jgi:DNA invertase Pin-like site-specific DNA recombinase
MSPNRHNKLTEGQKAVIQDRLNNGQTHHAIAYGTGIPQSTITSFLRRLKKRASDENFKNPLGAHVYQQIDRIDA